MRQRTRDQQREALRGWMKWVPILALVFAVLFTDTWLNTQIRANDYEYSRLKLRTMHLGKDLKTVRVEEAAHNALAYLDTEAPDLGLVKPEPMQIEVVRSYETTPQQGGMETMLLAQTHPVPGPVTMEPSLIERLPTKTEVLLDELQEMAPPQTTEVAPRLRLRPTPEEKAAPRRPKRAKKTAKVTPVARPAKPAPAKPAKEPEIDLDDSLDALLATL